VIVSAYAYGAQATKKAAAKKVATDLRTVGSLGSEHACRMHVSHHSE
jgi:hypothetical protein